MQLRQVYDEIVALDAEVVALSTDDLQGADYAVKQFGARFPIVYTTRDAGIPKQYEVFNLHGDGLASAAVFIIGKDGQLKWKEIGDRYSSVVPGKTLVQKLKEVAP